MVRQSSLSRKFPSPIRSIVMVRACSIALLVFPFVATASLAQSASTPSVTYWPPSPSQKDLAWYKHHYETEAATILKGEGNAVSALQKVEKLRQSLFKKFKQHRRQLYQSVRLVLTDARRVRRSGSLRPHNVTYTTKLSPQLHERPNWVRVSTKFDRVHISGRVRHAQRWKINHLDNYGAQFEFTLRNPPWTHTHARWLLKMRLTCKLRPQYIEYLVSEESAVLQRVFEGK